MNSTKNTVNTTWWNGQASYIDFTNPEAATWWSNELHDLLGKTGIDTLKFDAGESSWYVNYTKYLRIISTYEEVISLIHTLPNKKFVNLTKI